MNLFDRIERKFSKHAIPNLMYYIIICQIVGLVLSVINPTFLYNNLSLDMYRVIHNKQIWRLFTFVLIPDGDYSLNGVNIIFTAINLYFMYYFGRHLENVIGTVRFNMFYLSAIILNYLAALALCLCTGRYAYLYSYYFGGVGLNYVNMTLIMLCAFIFANTQVLFYFIIPIKMKYLGYLYLAMTVVNMVRAISYGYIWVAVAIFVALLNFALFYYVVKRPRAFSPKQAKRKIKYKEQTRNASNGPRHRCAVCGRTELDDETLEFRFCSRCDGNYEYCMEHLFTHEHIKRH